MNTDKLYNITIPNEFFDVQYNSSRIPGVEDQTNLTLGANCQVFAYELLRTNGLHIPNLRSSELWGDASYTKTVNHLKALDILLYNKTQEPYGAHVGIYIGNGKLIHLSQENKKAEIIEQKEMVKNEKYSVFIGAKRVLPHPI